MSPLRFFPGVFTLVLVMTIILVYGQPGTYDRIQFIKQSFGKNLSVFAIDRGLVFFDSNFTTFMKKYNKSYLTTEEIEYRKGNFLYSLDLITANNKNHQSGQTPYRLAVNRFADYGNNENYFVGQKFINADFIQRHVAQAVSPTSSSSSSSSAAFNAGLVGTNGKESVISPVGTFAYPPSFDWVSRGVVTPVQDQGQCGSCWAFAPLAVIESANAIANNSLVLLSAQQLMDCVRPPVFQSDGCAGGTADDAYQFVQRFGVVAEKDYRSYSATVGRCANVTGRWGEWIRSYHFLPLNTTDDQIQWALYNHGPVAAIVNAGDLEFQLYSGGVFTRVGSRSLYGDYNHYVTIVGWGTEAGIDYWLIKNSWGVDWGEDGYMKMARGMNSHGINTLVSYAIAAKQTRNQTVIDDTSPDCAPSSIGVSALVLFGLALLSIAIPLL